LIAVGTRSYQLSVCKLISRSAIDQKMSAEAATGEDIEMSAKRALSLFIATKRDDL
jgi:hypothetical protein